MDFVFSKHAEEQMQRRGINRKDVETVVLRPDQTLTDYENKDITVFQSLIKENGRMFLLRVFVNTSKLPNIIVTLYRTTKIQKYYESEI